MKKMARRRGKSKRSIFQGDKGGRGERIIQTKISRTNKREKCSKKAEEGDGEGRG